VTTQAGGFTVAPLSERDVRPWIQYISVDAIGSEDYRSCMCRTMYNMYLKRQ
jgi:hypothetical protein